MRTARLSIQTKPSERSLASVFVIMSRHFDCDPTKVLPDPPGLMTGGASVPIRNQTTGLDRPPKADIAESDWHVRFVP